MRDNTRTGDRSQIPHFKCKNWSRRDFLKTGSILTASLALNGLALGAPLIKTGKNDLLRLRAFPHPWMSSPGLIYGTNTLCDPFKSDFSLSGSTIEINQNEIPVEKFGINMRWYVDGFGFLNLEADNGGAFFSADDFSSSRYLNLNVEFARSRVKRNARVKSRYEKEGARFGSEIESLVDLSEELLEDSTKRAVTDELSAKKADQSLYYALWAGEKIELEKARQEINRRKKIKEIFFGCETRQYIWAKSEDFTKKFEELFNFATITHYIQDTWYEVFEPREGEYNWGIKDNIVNWLKRNDITIQGRPLFWFHSAVTPAWLKQKNFNELKDYVRRHTENVVGHYGDDVLQWEVVNEYHDWANIHNHTPDQITEIVDLACNGVKKINPKVKRIINNCCPWAWYSARGRMDHGEADRPLRSPRKFIEDIVNAGVDFEVVGLQMYFPRRDLSDIVRHLERFEAFGKPIYMTEIGASSGPTHRSVLTGDLGIPDGPYDWHRHWDQELQADWMEQVYTIFYSRNLVEACNWYDFADFRTFIQNGGLVTEACAPKPSYYRMKSLLESWKQI